MGLPVEESFTSGTANPGTSISLAMPTSLATGDACLIIVGNDDDTNTVQWDNTTNKPTGFTLIQEVGGAARDAHAAAFYRIIDGTESWPISVPCATSTDYWGYAVRISNPDTTSFLQQVGATYSGTSFTHGLTGVTTTVDDCRIYYVLAFDGADGAPFTVAGTGYSESAEIAVGTTGDEASGCWGARDMATAGASGTATVTSTAFDGAYGFQFAIAGASSSNVTGTGAGTLSSITGAASGAAGKATGTASGTAGAVTGSATGSAGDSTGAGAGDLSAFTGSAAGTISITGEGSGDLFAITGAATGTVSDGSGPVTGTASGSLPAFIGSASGNITGIATGVASGAISAFTGNSSGSVPVIDQPDQSSGGWGFWIDYERERYRKRARKKERDRLKEEARLIKDKLEMELAIELQKEEEEKERVKELIRLTDLVERYQVEIRQKASDSVIRSAERAIIQGNYSAMEALERELERMREEEEFLIAAINLMVA